MASDYLRPLLIIWPGRHDLLERFAERLAEFFPVLVDRRGGERRRADTSVEADRRRLERRYLLTPQARERFRARGYRLVYGPQAFREPDLPLWALAFCGECERVLELEMPRFVEPPAHLEAVVQHALSGGRFRHLVELEASTGSGQRLPIPRVDARELA